MRVVYPAMCHWRHCSLTSAMSPQSQLVCQFTRLSHSSRHVVLTELSEEFAPSDWWHLSTLLMARRGHFYDILGMLPVELALLAIEHLYPLEIIRLRAVCKRWNILLKSTEVCRMASRRYFSNYIPQQLQQSWTLFYENTLSRRHFYSAGQASIIHKLHNVQYTSFEPHVQYAYHNSRQMFAWISDSGDSFCVLSICGSRIKS